MVTPKIPESDEELMAECDVETYCATGPGGQNVNRRSTAVRLRHRPTGIMVTCQDERSQYRNKQIALENLRGKLKARFRRQRPRIPTKVPRGVRRETVVVKRQQGEKKALRKKPNSSED